MYLLIYLFIPIIMEFATKLALALHCEVTLVDTLETPEYCDVIKVLL